MTQPFISHFTPSLMSPETLEEIFVQREDIARRAVDLIRDSVLSGSKYHTLLIGPRGIGKTHLVSLVYHRIQAMEDVQGKLVNVWMREEEWGVASFLDFLMRIFRALPKEEADAVCDHLPALYTISPASAERAAEDLLIETLGDRTMLLIVENFDDLFAGLGDNGQKRFRAYLQNNPRFVILATSQSLFSAISLRSSPFYGFFRVQHLEEFDLSAAVELLTKIAQLKGDQELVDYLKTPAGRARVRAVHHLAGGNPRVYVIFSEFLTCQSLDDLVGPFMNMLDELTPYYQAKMRLLSPQQRKIMDFLVERRSAVVVKEIAQQCFITQQTASGQLKELRDKGYVQSVMEGRESFYELREVLMRLCLEVKKQRGEPIKLFVEFLRLWCTPLELKERLNTLVGNGIVDYRYLLEALRLAEDERDDPRVKACVQDFMGFYASGDIDNAVKVAEELVQIRGCIEDYVSLIHCLGSVGTIEEAQKSVNMALRKGHRSGYLYLAKAVNLFYLNHAHQALISAGRALEYNPYDVTTLNLYGQILVKLGLPQEALETFHEVLRWDNENEQAQEWVEIVEPYLSFARNEFLDKEEDTMTSDILYRQLAGLAVVIAQKDLSILGKRTGKRLIKSLYLEQIPKLGEYIVSLMFQREEEDWPHKILYAIDIYKRQDCLRVLSAGAFTHLKDIINKEIPEQKRRDWYLAWEQAAKGLDEFTVFLDVLRAVIGYTSTMDKRVLLELPIEQRAIAQELLGINTSAGMETEMTQ